MSHMEAATALYYTFSTIAQALAAAMALLAAFALYRLKGINDECLSSALVMEADTGGGSSVRVPAIASNWPAVRAEIERRLNAGQSAPRETIEARIARLDLLVRAHGRVLLALWVSLILTAAVVGASIAVLACVPRIVIACNAGVTLLGGVLATGFCLLSYIWLVIAAFRRV